VIGASSACTVLLALAGMRAWRRRERFLPSRPSLQAVPSASVVDQEHLFAVWLGQMVGMPQYVALAHERHLARWCHIEHVFADEQKLEELGITDALHRQTIAAQAAKVKKSDVVAFVKRLSRCCVCAPATNFNIFYRCGQGFFRLRFLVDTTVLRCPRRSE